MTRVNCSIPLLCVPRLPVWRPKACEVCQTMRPPSNCTAAHPKACESCQTMRVCGYGRSYRNHALTSSQSIAVQLFYEFCKPKTIESIHHINNQVFSSFVVGRWLMHPLNVWSFRCDETNKSSKPCCREGGRC